MASFKATKLLFRNLRQEQQINDPLFIRHVPFPGAAIYPNATACAAPCKFPWEARRKRRLSRPGIISKQVFMKYRYLGNSGLAVSRLCLGTMTFGNEAWGCDSKAAQSIVDAFIDAGGNFIDTADLYSAGQSEEILGNALKGKDLTQLVIASKCWFPVDESPNGRGLSRKHIVEACEASLKRMDLETIDLYQIHGPDPFTPIEETMRALDDLITAGKIRYAGCSNLYGWQIVKANAAAEKRGFEKFISGQYLYNLVRRDIETEILPACVDQGMGVLCWSPLAAGLLTGKYRDRDEVFKSDRFTSMTNLQDRYVFDEAMDLVELLVQIAADTGKSPTTVALAWLLREKAVSSVIAGARSAAQLADSIEAGSWDLPDEAYQKLTDKLPRQHGYPHEWMETALIPNFNKTEDGPERAQRFPPRLS